MDVLSAGEARKNFAAMLDKAQRGPVQIQKKGRPVAVVVSQEEFDQMNEVYREKMEALAQQWREKIARIKQEPSLDGEEVFRMLDEEFSKDG